MMTPRKKAPQTPQRKIGQLLGKCARLLDESPVGVQACQITACQAQLRGGLEQASKALARWEWLLRQEVPE